MIHLFTRHSQNDKLMWYKQDGLFGQLKFLLKLEGQELKMVKKSVLQGNEKPRRGHEWDCPSCWEGHLGQSDRKQKWGLCHVND